MEQELRKHFNFRLPPSLMERVDRARGKAGRTAFVEQAIMDKLAETERMGLYHCPSPGCDYTADSAAAICGAHGRKVARIDKLAV
jgi:hypothetical protein